MPAARTFVDAADTFLHGSEAPASDACGGGSGGVWLDRPKEERLSVVRVQQAAATGAEILAVACPYCLQMFEDSVKTSGLELEVKDVSELLAEAL